jgi:transposase
MPAKYRVTLSPEERETLAALISRGRAAARKLTHARILLQADATPGGPAWTDEKIVAALQVGAATVHRVRQAWVEEGLEVALNRQKPTGRQYRKLDGAQEARLVAVACSTPPEGRAAWTLQLLADQLVELKVVDTIGRECVRTTLKKTNCSPGGVNVGLSRRRKTRSSSAPWKTSWRSTSAPTTRAVPLSVSTKPPSNWSLK